MGSNPAFTQKRASTITQHGNKRRSMVTIEYRAWLAMKRRCYDTGFKDYPNWGGRGIRVCERWRDSFENFLADMGTRPAGMSLDRRESNADYSPGNCRWATALQQGETKRTNLPVTFDAVEYTSLREACRALGLRYTTVFSRVSAGYTVADALALGGQRAPARRTRESYHAKSAG